MKEIFSGTVTIEGWRKLTAEGQKGITAYSDEAVEIRVPGGMLRVYGKGLNIEEIGAEVLVLPGKIEPVTRYASKRNGVSARSPSDAADGASRSE